MHILLVLGLLGPMTQIEQGKLNVGMTIYQMKSVMGEPIRIGDDVYSFKSSTKCTSYTEVCSIIIKKNKVWQFMGVKPEMLASK